MKLVVFDVDGTLIDSEPHIYEAQCRAFVSVGFPPPDRSLSQSTIGLSLAEAMTVLVGPDGPVPQLVAAYKNARSVLRAEGICEMPFHGADDMLATLKGWPRATLGVATGKPREGVARTFKRLGWDRLFSTVQTADDGPSKPAPDMLHNAMRETGMPAFRTVVVGDTTFDAEMARRAKVEFIGVAWGNHATSDLITAGAASVASDFSELIEHLHAFLARG